MVAPLHVLRLTRLKVNLCIFYMSKKLLRHLWQMVEGYWQPSGKCSKWCLQQSIGSSQNICKTIVINQGQRLCALLLELEINLKNSRSR